MMTFTNTITHHVLSSADACFALWSGMPVFDTNDAGSALVRRRAPA